MYGVDRGGRGGGTKRRTAGVEHELDVEGEARGLCLAFGVLGVGVTRCTQMQAGTQSAAH